MTEALTDLIERVICKQTENSCCGADELAQAIARALTQAGEALTAAQKAGPVLLEALKRPISSIECRKPHEVFDIMCSRIAAIAQAQEPE